MFLTLLIAHSVSPKCAPPPGEHATGFWPVDSGWVGVHTRLEQA